MVSTKISNIPWYVFLRTTERSARNVGNTRAVHVSKGLRLEITNGIVHPRDVDDCSLHEINCVAAVTKHEPGFRIYYLLHA